MLWYKSNVIGNVNLIVISSFSYECAIFGFVTPFLSLATGSMLLTYTSRDCHLSTSFPSCKHQLSSSTNSSTTGMGWNTFIETLVSCRMMCITPTAPLSTQLTLLGSQHHLVLPLPLIPSAIISFLQI